MVLAPDSPRFTVLAASDAYLRATKKRREEIVGRPVFELFPDNPDDPFGAEANSRASFERVLRRTRRRELLPLRGKFPKEESEFCLWRTKTHSCARCNPCWNGLGIT